MNKLIQIIVVFSLFGLLIAIRVFLAPFFYDPLNVYFKTNYLQASIPIINFNIFFLNIFYRYFLNTIISLAIIYVIFKSRNTILFSIKFYILAFLVLSIILYFLLKFPVNNEYMLVFYVRRFLIQPLFLFILLPAFYYQKLKIGNKKT
jgi:exosortase F-associated protein